MVEEPFAGEAALEEGGRVEWAVAWPVDEEAYAGYYCNTVPTPLGGTHETGLRAALLKGLRAHAERIGFKQAGLLTADDIQGGAVFLLSLFIRQPQFQGQTKERLVSPEAARLVEGALRDRFDLWLGQHPAAATAILDHVIARAEERLARKKAKEEVGRKSATRKLRLPGKLADCARDSRDGTEIFIVEGDFGRRLGQAGARPRDPGRPPLARQDPERRLGRRRQARGQQGAAGPRDGARLRRRQALPRRRPALRQGRHHDRRRRGRRPHRRAPDDLLLPASCPKLIERGHLYLAQPPLYRLAHGATVAYARDDADRERLMATLFKGKKNIEVGRFKGLGEMSAPQLKETTMDPSRRQLLQVKVEDLEGKPVAQLVDELMGRRPELRFAFIQQNAAFVKEELDV